MIGYNTIRYTVTALVGLTLACATPKRSPLEEALSFRSNPMEEVTVPQRGDNRVEVQAVPEQGFIAEMKEEYGCIGVGKAPSSRNPSLIERAAKNAARNNYAKKCGPEIDEVGAAVEGIEVLFNPKQRLAIAYCPKGKTCTVK